MFLFVHMEWFSPIACIALVSRWALKGRKHEYIIKFRLAPMNVNGMRLYKETGTLRLGDRPYLVPSTGANPPSILRFASGHLCCCVSACSDWLRFDMPVHDVPPDQSDWPIRSCKLQRRNGK